MIVSPTPTPADQESTARFFSILWRSRGAILLWLVIGFALGAVGYMRSPVRYKAEAVLALDLRKLQALPNESVVSPLPQESPVLRTELDIIGSRTMAERVLAKLQAPLAASKSNRAFEEPDATKRAQEKAKMVDDLLRNVRVMNDGRSYTIYIAYTAADPDYAADVANAFGEAYLDYQIDLQRSATRTVSEWLGERLVSLRTKLEQSEREATMFRDKAGLVEEDGLSLPEQQIAGLNRELTALQTRLAGSRAKLETALELQKAGNGLNLNEVLSSPTIQLLRVEEAKVVRDIDEINQSGARMNPQLPQLTSQYSSLQKQIALEVTKVIEGLSNDIIGGERQEREILAKIRELQQDKSVTSSAMVQAAQLDREASANRTIYETYLARYKQTIEQDGIARAEARIISRAMPAKKAASPNPVLWATLSLLGGLSAGLGSAFLSGLRGRSAPSVALLQGKTGLPVIGRIPRLSARDLKKGIAFSKDTAPFHGAIADLAAHIEVLDSNARVIAFTASADGEGTTFVVSNLARHLALSGLRPLVIDANLRQPGVARQFRLEQGVHLSQWILGDMPFSQAVVGDPGSCIDMVAAEANTMPPEIVFGHRRFAALIEEARKRYDIVLIDAPALGHESDLLRISKLADSIAFVVQLKTCNMSALQDMLLKLRMTGRHLGGIVVNGVQAQKERSRARSVHTRQETPQEKRDWKAAPKPAPVFAQNAR